MPNHWPGSQKPIHTEHPLFQACANDPMHQAEYAKVAEAEAFYTLHKTKADKLFRVALFRVKDARRNFRGKVHRLYLRVAPTLPPAPLTLEQQEDADRVAAYREEKWINRRLYLAESIADQEALYRAVLDQPERFELPDELRTDGMQNGNAIITHRHAVYATMLGFLLRQGLDGLQREWNDWGRETYRAFEQEDGAMFNELHVHLGEGQGLQGSGDRRGLLHPQSHRPDTRAEADRNREEARAEIPTSLTRED